MTFVLLMLWGSGMLVVARWICGRWFNHLSLYTIMWTVSLLALELRLLAYHTIIFEAWLYIFVAWVSIYLGTAIGRLASPGCLVRKFPDLKMNQLRNVIVLLSLAGFVSSAILAWNIVLALGTGDIVSALMERGNDIYAMRFEGEVSGIMYLVFLPYAGCVLAGVYTARLGRIVPSSTLPLLAMLVDGILSMQRAGMAIGAMLFAFSYVVTPKVSKLQVTQRQKTILGSAVLGFVVLVTAGRGGVAIFEGESATLARAGDSVSILPSLYLYASAPVACFSEYLKHPENDGKALWGRYMFASIYRFLSKFGFDTYVPYYQPFYDTPVPVNVGTYLREVHRDFGGSAIFLYPFFLGLSIALLESRGPGLYSAVLLSFLYLVVAFSIDLNFVGGGGWYFPLPITLFALATLKIRPVRQAMVSGKAATPLPT